MLVLHFLLLAAITVNAVPVEHGAGKLELKKDGQIEEALETNVRSLWSSEDNDDDNDDSDDDGDDETDDDVVDDDDTNDDDDKSKSVKKDLTEELGLDVSRESLPKVDSDVTNEEENSKAAKSDESDSIWDFFNFSSSLSESSDDSNTDDDFLNWKDEKDSGDDDSSDISDDYSDYYDYDQYLSSLPIEINGGEGLGITLIKIDARDKETARRVIEFFTDLAPLISYIGKRKGPVAATKKGLEMTKRQKVLQMIAKRKGPEISNTIDSKATKCIDEGLTVDGQALAKCPVQKMQVDHHVETAAERSGSGNNKN